MRGLTRRRRLLLALALAPLVFVVATCGQVVALAVVDPLTTHTMLSRGLAARRWPQSASVDLSKLPRHVPAAVVTSEDGAFFFHDGFDWGAICKALDGPESKDGKPKRGGSSITQQVARNVFLWQKRSWVRKGLEAWYTFLLELLLSKQRILEVYLSVAEFGPLTFGVESGAQKHFGVPAAKLSHEQAARLAAILPSPNKWRVGGETAGKRVEFVARNRPPWPGEPEFAAARDRWRAAARGPCFPR